MPKSPAGSAAFFGGMGVAAPAFTMHPVIKSALAAGIIGGAIFSWLPAGRAEIAPSSHVRMPTAAATTEAKPGPFSQAAVATRADEEKPCHGLVVDVIARLDDDEKSMAALRSDNGPAAVVTKGSTIANRRVLHVGNERVWLMGTRGDVCFAEIFRSAATADDGKDFTQEPGWFRPFIAR